MAHLLRSQRGIREYAVIVTFAAMFTVLSITSSAFLTKTNILNLLDQNSTIIIMAAASTFVIIGAGFDISLGAVLTLSAVASAAVAVHVNFWAGLLAGPLTGVVCGLINATLVGVVRISSIIATLATNLIFAGVAVAATDGGVITVPDQRFAVLASPGYRVLGVQYDIIIALVFAAVLAIILTRTVFGRHVFAVGGNPLAAWLSGINVAGVRAATFVLSGFSAGLAGAITASRIGAGEPTTDPTIVLAVIAAVVVGGTSVLGGEGAVWRTVLGVMFIALIGNGFDLLQINTIYQQIAEGVIVVLAVSFDTWSRKRQL
jgi:ribose transport system permease protein